MRYIFIFILMIMGITTNTAQKSLQISFSEVHTKTAPSASKYFSLMCGFEKNDYANYLSVKLYDASLYGNRLTFPKKTISHSPGANSVFLNTYLVYQKNSYDDFDKTKYNDISYELELGKCLPNKRYEIYGNYDYDGLNKIEMVYKNADCPGSNVLYVTDNKSNEIHNACEGEEYILNIKNCWPSVPELEKIEYSFDSTYTTCYLLNITRDEMDNMWFKLPEIAPHDSRNMYIRGYINDTDYITLALGYMKISKPQGNLSASVSYTHVNCNKKGEVLVELDKTIYNAELYDTYECENHKFKEYPGGKTLFPDLYARDYILEIKKLDHPCPYYQHITILDQNLTGMDVTGKKSPICNGTSDGGFRVRPLGGLAPYRLRVTHNGDSVTYDFNTTKMLTGLKAGSYKLVLTDVNQCTVEKTEVIEESPPFTLQTQKTDVTCFGKNNGRILYPASPPGYSYYLKIVNNSSDHYDTKDYPPGKYLPKAVLTKNNLYCNYEQADSLSITEPAPISLKAISTTNTVCKGTATGTLSSVIKGGTKPYDIKLYYIPPPGYHVFIKSIGVIDSVVASGGLFAGSWKLETKDNNGCVFPSQYFSILDPPSSLVVANQVNSISCHMQNDGQISLLPSGGWGGYQTTWSDGYTGLVRNNLAPGTYSAQVTDAGGCTVSTPGLSVIEPLPLTLTPVMHPASCYGKSDGKIKLILSGGTKPYTVVFVGEPTVTNLDTLWITSLPAGNYSVGLTDAKQCQVMPAVVEITQPQPLEISSVVQPVTCHGLNNGRIDITSTGGNGGYSYAWNDGVNSRDRSSLSPGNYTLDVSDLKGCTAEGTFAIVEPSPLTLEADIDIKANGKHLTCYGGTDARVSLHSTGGNENHVYRVISPVYQVLDSFIIDQLGAGTLEIEVVDQKGCTSQVECTITGPEQPIQVNSTIEHVTGCYGDSTGMISLNATGGNEGFSYHPAGDDALFPGTYNNLPGGTYTFEVLDAFGCSENLSLEVLQPEKIVFSSPAVTHPRCYGSPDGRIMAQASGGTSPLRYTLASLEEFISSGDFNNLQAGDYQVLAVDANLCEAMLPVIQLVDPQRIALNASWLDVACKSARTGWLSLPASGGTGDLFIGYKLKAPDAFYMAYSDTVKNLGAGRYPVVARDENLCQLVDTIEISEPEHQLRFDTNTPVSRSDYHGYQVTQCQVDDGWAELHASGGNSPLGYSLTRDGQTLYREDGYFGNLRAGVYQANVMDAGGCSIDTLVIMLSPSTIELDSVNRLLPDCQSSNGEISAFLSGGAGKLTSNWYKGTSLIKNDESLVSGLYSGIYTLETRDVNSCTRIDTIVLPDKSGPRFDISIDKDISCYNTSDGQVRVNMHDNPSPVHTIQWIRFPAEESLVLRDIPAGRYYAMIVDEQTCTGYGEVELVNPEALALAFSLTPGRCHADSAAVVELFPSGGRPPYQYARADHEPFSHPVFDHLPAGKNIFVLTDQNGCRDTIEIQVPDQEKTHTSFSLSSPRCYGEHTGQIDLIASGGNPPYLYSLGKAREEWSGVPRFGMLASGPYLVRIKDEHDCPDSIHLQLDQPLAIELHAGQIEPSECLHPTGSTTVLATGGTGILSLTWEHLPGHTGFAAGNLSAGLHKVTGTDSLGCKAILNILIPSLEGPVIDSLWSYPASCHDRADGIIHLRLEEGSTASIARIGDEEYAGFPIGGLLPGNYILEVINNKGCRSITEAVIMAPPPLVLAELAQVAPACPDQTNGSIQAMPRGGTPPYRLRVNNQEIEDKSFALHQLGAGDYILEISDSRECHSQERISLENPPSLVLSLPDTIKICPGQQKILYHGLPEVSTTWNIPSGEIVEGDSILLSQVGDYMLTVVSAKMCEATAHVHLEVSSNLLETNFLMCSEVEVFDTLLILDITWPVPAYVSWEIPGSLPVLGGNHETRIIEAREAGTYTIYMEALLEGCYDKIGKQLVVHPRPKSGQEIDPDAVNLPETLLEVSLYPNPTRESAKLVIRKEEDAAVVIDMYNIHGAKQETIHLPGPGIQVEHEINVKNLPAGMYLVRVQSGRQITLVHLVKVSN